MQNEEGEIVDKLIPRKCNATGGLILPLDHASVQFRIAAVDGAGRPTGMYEMILFGGCLRTLSETDNAMNGIAIEKGLLTGIGRQ
jgi:small subunit ribosomal protein S21e